MNENVGASFGLSLLVVAFFAIALYQPDQPRDQARPVAKTAAAEPAAVRTTTKPATTTPNPAPPARQVSRRVVEETSKRGDTVPSGPQGAFTTARAGEQLKDIALRVYGKSGSVEKLWKANRDLVDRLDEPLRTGRIVRTP